MARDFSHRPLHFNEGPLVYLIRSASYHSAKQLPVRVVLIRKSSRLAAQSFRLVVPGSSANPADTRENRQRHSFLLVFTPTSAIAEAQAFGMLATIRSRIG